MNIERGIFEPLVFSCTWGMGNESTAFFKMLASKMSEKIAETYFDITKWMRCKLSFITLRSCILSLRGRGTKTKKVGVEFDLVDNFNVACYGASIQI